MDGGRALRQEGLGDMGPILYKFFWRYNLASVHIGAFYAVRCRISEHQNIFNIECFIDLVIYFLLFFLFSLLFDLCFSIRFISIFVKW